MATRAKNTEVKVITNADVPAPAKKQKVTVKGITVEVSADVMDDIDMLEWIGEMQEGNIFVFPKILRRMFGDNYAVVKEKLSTEHGITTTTEMTDFFTGVMNALSALDAKN
ncbi:MULTISPECIES: hypothetical protein [Gordonibacter]|uniref:Uncharacterized protein n=1 Tax=Gordonibacter faecis TaxID=3047475 RepID=A0ABT7DPZ5_9ACTN|nr:MULTISPECIES: hypothetical protein [unclassified Gordonibacter]MDJ1651625.1 hypothetical protein [Gordonibacter sp. KGMB12511]HIW77047.1 hypothetical protein [Candidatus Gordonibacter avicola]